jgi:ribonuclease T2
MQTYWKDYQGNDESFWEHEFGKHGTCMSTLETACYPKYQVGDEVVDYFKRSVEVFKTLPSYEWLAAAGIVPSTTATYTLAAIQAALKSHHGHDVIINCSGGKLNELWYHYNVQGSIQSGEFAPTDPVGAPSTCPKTGIKYLPKSGSNPTGTTTSPPTSTATGEPGPGELSGKGYLYVSTDASASGGFLISGGTWYRNGGTPATYTATPDGSGSTFTLKTSKGNCAVQSDSSLTCAASVSAASSFGYDGAYLTYDGSNTFYATALPSGSTQGTVYTTSKSVSFQVTWKAV